MELILDGPNDISGMNPLFVDPTDLSIDLRLTENSPCVNTGITVGAPAQDLNGNDRVGEVDMGTYEFQGMMNGAFEPLSSFGDLRISPTIVDSDLVFSFESSTNENITTQIIDRNGKILLSEIIDKQTEMISPEFDITKLASGIYFLTISNGEKANTKSFIKR